MKNALRMVSTVLVLCLLLSNMSVTAFAEAVLALPSSMQIIDEKAFYGAKSLDKVVLPATIKEIRSRAFANSSVKTINLPASLTFIADDAFVETPLANVTAEEGTYAYDWAVQHNYIVAKIPITIHSFSSNISQAETGTPITCTVDASGGVAPLTYNYAVFKNGLYQEDFSIAETDETFFTFTPSTDGYWSVLLTISDSLETVASEISDSIYVVDVSSYGNVELSLVANLNQVLVGDTVQITAGKRNTFGNVMYSFSASNSLGSVFASQNSSTNPVFVFSASDAGNIIVTCTATDELGRSATEQKEIYIYSKEELKPSVPGSIQMNGYSLPSTSENSSLFPQSDYRFTWDKVNDADSYSIHIVKTVGESSEILADVQELRETSYTLTSKLLSSITEEALICVTVYAHNRINSDPCYGFFRVKTSDQQQQIFINGFTTAAWNEVYYAGTSRVFEIESDLDWTASSHQEWISCYRDGNRLTVVIAENPYKTQVINGSVTVSNGSQSAQIEITHGYLEEAPKLLAPSLSQTELTTNNHPYGDLYLKFDEKEAYYVTAKLYKKNGSEYTYIAEKSTNKSTMCLSVPTSIHAGDLCMIELTGYTEAGFQTKDISAQKTTTKYYFTFSNEQHFIQVDGQESSSYQIIDTATVQIHASTVWSWQSDCDWLQITVSNDEFAPDCKAYIRATANQTGEKRIGHLTIISGTSTAQITVMQDSFVPYVSYPTGLSQSPNSPTTLPMNNLSFIWHMASYISIIRDSDGFVMLQKPLNSQTGDSINDVDTESFEKTDWKANSTYTITLSNDYYTSYYYFKIGTSNSYYINLSDSENSEVNILDWTVSAEAQTKTVTMKASGAWTITTDSEWLSVSATSGSKTTAGKSITVTVQQNTTGVSRTGNIIFKRGTYAEAVLHIEQAAINYLIVMNSDTLVPYANNDTIYHISGKNDDFSLKVKTGCSWSVSSDSSWLAFDRSGSTTKDVTNTNTTLRIYCEENTIGNQTRVAKLTFSAGNDSFVLFISQDACIDVPVVSTTITSTNINNPSVILYQDINFTWSPVAGAAKYVVKVMTSASDYTQQYYVEEDGSSEYSFTIPYSWLTVDGKAYFFRVNSIDQQGYEYTAPRYCYTVVYDEKATINGSTRPSWDNASDYQASQEFIVMSTSSWTAVAQQSWIHVSTSSGKSGDTLTVTLDDNTGARREGSVRISVNGNATILNISQCAKLAEWPTINTPAYSEDEYYPTIISSDISSLTVAWDVEPQADSYFIHLDSYKSTGTWHGEKKIENISVAQAGSYTISNLHLTADNLYKLTLVRCANGRKTAGTSVYFIPQNGLSTVSLGNNDPSSAELDAEGDYQRVTINSSGTWIASCDSDWIMVYKDSLDQSDLDEKDREPSYYNSLIGNPGTSLYISVLANKTGLLRSGNVTITCGNASLTIPVSQNPNITTAKIINPTLGTYKIPAKVPYQSLHLSWSEGIGGTGKYHLVLREREPGDKAWNTILETTSSSKCTYTINQSKLTEGFEYLLRLVTEADNSYDDWETYYFSVAYKNELTLALSLNTDYAYTGGKVIVSANASGGAGGYHYEFELLKEGESVHASELDTINARSFALDNAGIYQIRAMVVDALDYSSIAFTVPFIVASDDQQRVSYNTIMVADESDDWVAYPTIGDDNEIAYPTIGSAFPEPTHSIRPIPTITDPTDETEWDFEETPFIDESIFDFDSYPYISEPSPTHPERTLDTFSFTILKGSQPTEISSTDTNKTIRFKVKAAHADQVCLVVDGKSYEMYDVIDGEAVIKRSFSQSGERIICFDRYIAGEWVDRSSSKTLTVNASRGTLGAISIEPVPDVVVDQDVTITLHAVDNAEVYLFVLSKDDKPYLRLNVDRWDGFDAGTELYMTIYASDLLGPGRYEAYFMAMAEGYEYSENNVFFNVIDNNTNVGISYPYEGAKYNIGDTMHTTIVTDNSSLYKRLLVTDRFGETTVYMPDNNGMCFPVASEDGEYKLKAIASTRTDFSNPYESKEIIVFVEGPQASLSDVWGNQYGVVYTKNVFKANIRVNCTGNLDVFIDNAHIPASDIEQSIDDPYLFAVQVRGLIEGKHTISAKVTYGNYTSEIASIDVYSITQLPSSEQLTYYATADTEFEYYPKSKSRKKIAYKGAVVFLGTYNNDYAYVKYGGLYGFVKKEVFKEWQIIEQMEQALNPVESSDSYLVDEMMFREWAATVIEQYYQGYGMFDKEIGQRFMAQFKNVHPVYNYIAGRNGTANVEMINTEFDGAYREYYFTALFKQYYDQYGRKSTYNVLHYDAESEEEYREKMIPYYKEILINTLKRKGEIDEYSFTRVNPSDVGVYSLKYNPSTGKMTMQLDINGRMGNLHDSALLEMQNAWQHFTVDVVETCIDATIYYFNCNPVDKNQKFNRVAGEAIVEGLANVLKNSFDANFENEMNKLENNLTEIIKAEIANSVLQDYNRIIAYLESIYGGSDDSLIEYISDPLFMECVQELIELSREQRFIQSEQYAKSVLAEWAVSEMTNNIVLSDDELFLICMEDFVDQLITCIMKVVKGALDMSFGDDHVLMNGLYSVLTDFVSVYIHEIVANTIKAQKAGKQYSIDSLLSNSGKTKLGTTISNNLLTILSELEKKEGNNSFSNSVSYELTKTLISKISKLHKIQEKYGTNYNDAFWNETRDLLVETVSDVLASSWKSLVKADKTSKIPEKLQDVINTAVNMKDDIVKTADSLAKAYLSTKNYFGNEQQVSLNASLMYASYVESYKYLVSIKSEIKTLQALAQQKGISLRTCITDPNYKSVKEILKITDCIMLQVETDVGGCDYLIALMNLCENSRWRPQFYSDLLKEIKGTPWETRISSNVAKAERALIYQYLNAWKKGWKEEYRLIVK